jgi:hypothetical protein
LEVSPATLYNWRRAEDMLKEVLGVSERVACKAIGLARSTYRDIRVAQTLMLSCAPGCGTTPLSTLVMGFVARGQHCATMSAGI